MESTLSGTHIHDAWHRDYRSPASEAFFEAAFDRLVGELDPPPGAVILDAGCGAGLHTVRLARRGFRVHAVDVSIPVLEEAQRNVARAGLSDRVTFSRENLLALPFPDRAFSYVLCWGVLMHVPEVRAAIAELARVVGPEGKLAVSEINVRSLQRAAFVGLTRVLGRSRAEEVSTPAGKECWFETEEGTLLRRHTDLDWLIGSFAEEGLRLARRLPGQFTELYLKVRSPAVQAWIHRWNAFYFRSVRAPGPAFGNILIFRRPRDGDPPGREPRGGRDPLPAAP